MTTDSAHQSKWTIAEVVFGLPFLSAVGLEFIYPGPPQIGFFRFIQILFGVVPIIVSLWMIGSARRELAKHHQPTDPGQSTTELVTTGLYSISRNPLYLAAVLFFLGIYMVFDIFWGIYALVLSILLCQYILVIPEQNYLARKFRGEYWEYAAIVHQWLGRNKPSSVNKPAVKPTVSQPQKTRETVSVRLNPNLEIALPVELIPYQDQIQATVKPYIKITAAINKDLAPWQSKFGGKPYLPIGYPHPMDSHGLAMHLLAQINFSETPPLAKFPTNGILQVYISGGSDVYGVDFDNPASQKDFRVIYHPEIVTDPNQLVSDFSYLPRFESLPLLFQSGLKFAIGYSPITVSDYQFEPKILTRELDERREVYTEFAQVYQAYEETFPATGHKLGGYPYFTQDDPRRIKREYRNAVLLMQMDTDDDASMMWGDCGVANFFIEEQDLINKDFSKVIYHWDCC